MKKAYDVKIHLIRHGETARNAGGDLIGQSPEEPLSDLGVRQADLLRKRINEENWKIDNVYCSTYMRARQTAGIACQTYLKDKLITESPELRELWQGDMTDKSRKETFTEDNLRKMKINGMGFAWPNAESMFEVEARMVDYLLGVDAYHLFPNETDYVVFSHGLAIKCFLHHIMQFDHRFTWKIDIANTSITTIRHKGGEWFLDRLNDTAHLTHQ
jgi:broad specificity phosphatase PhoE